MQEIGRQASKLEVEEVIKINDQAYDTSSAPGLRHNQAQRKKRNKRENNANTGRSAKRKKTDAVAPTGEVPPRS